MDNIEKQLKTLKSIKPDNDWILSTKAFILEPEHVLARPRNFSFRLQPALVIPLLMVIIAGSGFGLHLTLQNRNTVITYQPATYLAMIEEKLGQTIDNEEIVEIGDMLDKAVNKITQTDNASESAVIVEHISSINKKVEELEIPELQEKTQVLTSMASETIENKIENTTQALVENLIKMLQIQELDQDQEELFMQAKTDYNNKNYNKALETILMLTNE